jgi:hypothetical protein
MPYFENPTMLALQYTGWRKWSEKRKARLRVILVDDGSGQPAAEVPRPNGLPALEIYRVKENRPWHQHAARNLGAMRAPGGWMLMTDMDHVLTDDAARILFKRMDAGQLYERGVYLLDRYEADTGLPTTDVHGNPKPHPNSFVLTREMYWRIGGYDEDYCGIYGTDGLFRHRAFTVGRKCQLDVPLIRFWRDIVADASTTTLPRKEGRDPFAKERVAAEKAARGEADVVKVLQFDWERVL